MVVAHLTWVALSVVRAEHGPSTRTIPATHDQGPQVTGSPEVQVAAGLVPLDVLSVVAN